MPVGRRIDMGEIEVVEGMCLFSSKYDNLNFKF